MLRALVQESHLDLRGIGTSRFDWGICSFYDNEDSHALFYCKVLGAQVQSLAKHGIIWIEREIVRKGDCMVASLCPPATQSKASCNAISIRSRKDWEEYLLKRLGQVTLVPSFSVVIEEIVETPVNPRSSDSGKGEVLSTIRGFTPLVLALPVVTRLTSLLIQEGAAIALAIRGFDHLILPKFASRVSGVSGSKALEAILPSPMVINLKMSDYELCHFTSKPIGDEEGTLKFYGIQHHATWAYF